MNISEQTALCDENLYKYKTELHCHTAESSLECGKVSAKDIVNIYEDAGYSTLVITDHFGGKHISDKGIQYDICTFYEGYKCAVEAKKNINLILGVEVNLAGSANDYLVYGITEDFVRENPEMYRLTAAEFCDFVHEKGLLVYQAHPFRDRMTIIHPSLCDGIEVFNAHPKHDSRNNIAMEWAKMYGKNAISGSDAHRPAGMALSGIKTKEEIKTSAELLSVLRSCDYKLITF